MAVKDIAIGGTELNTFSVLSSDKNLKVGDNFFLGNHKIQDAMENFVFPDEMKTKLKMYEFMNIFPNLTGIPQKKLQKVFFIFTEQTVKKAFMFWTGMARQMH